jgi:hypothetical protein
METGRLHITGDETHELKGRDYIFHRVFKQIQAWSAANFSGETGIVPEDKYEVDQRSFESKTEVLECWIDAKGRKVKRIKVEGGRIYTQTFKKNGELHRLTIDPEFIN